MKVNPTGFHIVHMNARFLPVPLGLGVVAVVALTTSPWAQPSSGIKALDQTKADNATKDQSRESINLAGQLKGEFGDRRALDLDIAPKSDPFCAPVFTSRLIKTIGSVLPRHDLGSIHRGS